MKYLIIALFAVGMITATSSFAGSGCCPAKKTADKEAACTEKKECSVEKKAACAEKKAECSVEKKACDKKAE